MIEQSEQELLYQRIILLTESELRNLVLNVFNRNGYTTELTHGSSESGADLILEVPQEMDIVGRNQFFLFQIKVGDIGIPIWRKVIYGQLTQLYCRPYSQIYSNEMAPRRIILITSGTFTEDVKKAITNWNSKLPIPVEAFSGRQFARLLDDHYSVKASEMDGLIKRRNIVKL